MAEDQGFDESSDIGDDDRVTLVDDEGNELECVILAVAEFEGADYALLAEEAKLLDESEEAVEMMLFTFSASEEEGVEVFGPIDNDELYGKVQAYFESLMESELEG